MQNSISSILLVEDDQRIREEVAMSLELGGYEVIQCGSALE